MKVFYGNIIDVINRKTFKGSVHVENGIIKDIKPEDSVPDVYILPGLIDSHVHVESSMLIPSEFAGIIIPHGTVGIISDPHEIANVLGKEGVRFMINNASKVPLKSFFCVPSCVPATDFESSGANLSAADIDEIMESLPVKILGEMMNFPGVINNNEEVMDKINAAIKHNAIIDGHIPGVSGEALKKYISAGISTDHECFTYNEAVEKIKLGMKILIREGSAAKNFNELYKLISDYTDMCMLCTDDSHPDDIIKYGHIDKIINMALNKGLNLYDVLQTATVNPVKHYNIPIGLLQKGDAADFILIDNPKDFNVLETIINGNVVYSNGRLLMNKVEEKPINKFQAEPISLEDIKLSAPENPAEIRVIEVIDKELITKFFFTAPNTNDEGNIVSNPQNDVLKIIVYNRYEPNVKPAVGFINGFGLKQGAIASSIAHDSHNIIAVGVDDHSIVKAVNEIVRHQGGLCFVDDMDFYSIPLPYAGLMTDERPEIVAEKYEMLNSRIKSAGSKLTAPFMTLSFMALLVIPELKIGDKGLFDVNKFEFAGIFADK